ncbi:hypothetical protein IU449_10225 [Nocardia higoensis]|uniref:Uncharacterized protein n=1 Tax=Nocardia higoensis TaxID=228599 RepID=A0ABS0DAQ8_9NOCA|nr:hypothetical protein [Nocardia higoensis]MBF6354918.1 hypothetical protein [Nocardia higoensis]
MKATVVPAGLRGYEYVVENLRYGLAAARAVLPLVEGMRATAMVPHGAAENSWFEFRAAAGKATIRELTEFVIDRFPGCLIIAEQPLRRPGDPHLSHHVFERVVLGEEVFAVCTTSSPEYVVTRTLNAQDPTYLYCVFVIEDNVKTRAWLRGESTEIVSDTADLRLVIVGAYDGEGFVMLAPDDPFTGS